MLCVSREQKANASPYPDAADLLHYLPPDGPCADQPPRLVFRGTLVPPSGWPSMKRTHWQQITPVPPHDARYDTIAVELDGGADICFEYGPPPVIRGAPGTPAAAAAIANVLRDRAPLAMWLVTGRAWYRLMKPSAEYGEPYLRALRRRVDLAARAVQLLQIRPNTDFETVIQSITGPRRGVDGWALGESGQSYTRADLEAEGEFLYQQVRAVNHSGKRRGRRAVDEMFGEDEDDLGAEDDEPAYHHPPPTAHRTPGGRGRGRGRAAAPPAPPPAPARAPLFPILAGFKRMTGREKVVVAAAPLPAAPPKPVVRVEGPEDPEGPFDYSEAFLYGDRNTEEIEKMQGKQRGPPPTPHRDFLIPQGPFLADALSVWDLIQSHADVLQVPPMPFRRLEAALMPAPSHPVYESGPDGQPIKSAQQRDFEASVRAAYESGRAGQGADRRRTEQDDGLDPEPAPLLDAPSTASTSGSLWHPEAEAAAAVLLDVHVSLLQAAQGAGLTAANGPSMGSDRTSFKPPSRASPWLYDVSALLSHTGDASDDEFLSALHLLHAADYCSLPLQARVAVLRYLAEAACSSGPLATHLNAKVQEAFGPLPTEAGLLGTLGLALPSTSAGPGPFAPPAASGPKTRGLRGNPSFSNLGGGRTTFDSPRVAGPGGPTATSLASSGALAGVPPGEPGWNAIQFPPPPAAPNAARRAGDRGGSRAVWTAMSAAPRGSREEWRLWRTWIHRQYAAWQSMDHLRHYYAHAQSTGYLPSQGLGRCLGRDFFNRRYWLLGGEAGSGCVFVENPKTASWGYYTRDQVGVLLRWLAQAHVEREMGLIHALCVLEGADPALELDAMIQAALSRPKPAAATISGAADRSTVEGEAAAGTRGEGDASTSAPLDGYADVHMPLLPGMFGLQGLDLTGAVPPTDRLRIAVAAMLAPPLWSPALAQGDPLPQIAAWAAELETVLHLLRANDFVGCLTALEQALSARPGALAATWTPDTRATWLRAVARDCTAPAPCAMLLAALQPHLRPAAGAIRAELFQIRAASLGLHCIVPAVGDTVVLCRSGIALSLAHAQSDLPPALPETVLRATPPAAVARVLSVSFHWDMSSDPRLPPVFGKGKPPCCWLLLGPAPDAPLDGVPALPHPLAVPLHPDASGSDSVVHVDVFRRLFQTPWARDRPFMVSTQDKAGTRFFVGWVHRVVCSQDRARDLVLDEDGRRQLRSLRKDALAQLGRPKKRAPSEEPLTEVRQLNAHESNNLKARGLRFCFFVARCWASDRICSLKALVSFVWVISFPRAQKLKSNPPILLSLFPLDRRQIFKLDPGDHEVVIALLGGPSNFPLLLGSEPIRASRAQGAQVWELLHTYGPATAERFPGRFLKGGVMLVLGGDPKYDRLASCTAEAVFPEDTAVQPHLQFTFPASAAVLTLGAYLTLSGTLHQTDVTQLLDPMPFIPIGPFAVTEPMFKTGVVSVPLTRISAAAGREDVAPVTFTPYTGQPRTHAPSEGGKRVAPEIPATPAAPSGLGEMAAQALALTAAPARAPEDAAAAVATAVGMGPSLFVADSRVLPAPPFLLESANHVGQDATTAALMADPTAGLDPWKCLEIAWDVQRCTAPLPAKLQETRFLSPWEVEACDPALLLPTEQLMRVNVGEDGRATPIAALQARKTKKNVAVKLGLGWAGDGNADLEGSAGRGRRRAAAEGFKDVLRAERAVGAGGEESEEEVEEGEGTALPDFQYEEEDKPMAGLQPPSMPLSGADGGFQTPGGAGFGAVQYTPLEGGKTAKGTGRGRGRGRGVRFFPHSSSCRRFMPRVYVYLSFAPFVYPLFKLRLATCTGNTVLLNAHTSTSTHTAHRNASAARTRAPMSTRRTSRTTRMTTLTRTTTPGTTAGGGGPARGAAGAGGAGEAAAGAAGGTRTTRVGRRPIPGRGRGRGQRRTPARRRRRRSGWRRWPPRPARPRRSSCW